MVIINYVYRTLSNLMMTYLVSLLQVISEIPMVYNFRLTAVAVYFMITFKGLDSQITK